MKKIKLVFEIISHLFLLGLFLYSLFMFVWTDELLHGVWLIISILGMQEIEPLEKE